MKKTSLDKFIKIRNKAINHNNLQFQIDAEEAGLDLQELGDPIRLKDGEYAWHTPFGQLVEHLNFKLELTQ